MESTTRKGNEMRTRTYKIRDHREADNVKIHKDHDKRYAMAKVNAILNERHGSLYAPLEQERATEDLVHAAEAVPGFIVSDPAIPNLTVQLDEGCDD